MNYPPRVLLTSLTEQIWERLCNHSVIPVTGPWTSATLDVKVCTRIPEYKVCIHCIGIEGIVNPDGLLLILKLDACNIEKKIIFQSISIIHFKNVLMTSTEP